MSQRTGEGIIRMAATRHASILGALLLLASAVPTAQAQSREDYIEFTVAVETALGTCLGPPPAQIPAGAANALGSCLGYERQIAFRARDA
jgi:hypothetical protein